MFFFNKKSARPEQIEFSAAITDYQQATHIPRGSKRIKLASYGNDAAEAGIEYFNRHDTAGLTLTAKVYEGSDARVEIELDSVPIGSIWNHSWPEQYKLFRSEAVGKVYAKVEGSDAYVFVLPK